jgi:hypothetical protein
MVQLRRRIQVVEYRPHVQPARLVRHLLGQVELQD